MREEYLICGNSDCSPVLISNLFIMFTLSLLHLRESGAPLALLVECRSLDRKVAGSNLARGAVLCP